MRIEITFNNMNIIYVENFETFICLFRIDLINFYEVNFYDKNSFYNSNTLLHFNLKYYNKTYENNY